MEICYLMISISTYICMDDLEMTHYPYRLWMHTFHIEGVKLILIAFQSILILILMIEVK